MVVCQLILRRIKKNERVIICKTVRANNFDDMCNAMRSIFQSNMFVGGKKDRCVVDRVSPPAYKQLNEYSDASQHTPSYYHLWTCVVIIIIIFYYE